ncbi:MAG: hypothetical protein ACO1SX_07145 [Actinomycetota bacterium]
MDAVRCLACGGETTRCYLVAAGTSGFECHGMEKNDWGISRRRAVVTERVCVECGYVMQFATEPRKFAAELGPEVAKAARLPIPAGAEGGRPVDAEPS